MRLPVLVTGAGGFAGSHLMEHLAASGVAAVGWRRQDVDLLDRDAVHAAIRALSPQTVFHCAAQAHVGASFATPAGTYRTNVLGTHHLLDGLRRAGAHARVVITGSSHIYTPSASPIAEAAPIDPTSPYALSKLAQEELGFRAIAEDALEVVVARAFNHTGPRQDSSFLLPGVARQIAQIERGQQPPVIQVGNTEPVRDLTDVRDVVRAYVALAERGRAGVAYNVASGSGRTVRAMIDALVARARVPIGVEIDPARVRPSDTPFLVGDAGRLREETGWAPQIPFEQTLDDLLEYWRAHR